MLRFVFEGCQELGQVVFHLPDEGYKKGQLAGLLQNAFLFETLREFKVLRREKVLSRFMIRRAREEDQDDLSEICNRQTELRTEIFGEFFLAEMISSASQDKICLVAQNEREKVVGILVASDDVDYEVLTRNYRLGAFQCLTKGDFHGQYLDQLEARARVARLRAAQEVEQRNEVRQIYRKLFSKTFLVQELQQHCVERREDIFKVFRAYLEDEEKQRQLNQSVLRKKFNRFFKDYKISVPNELYARELNLEVSTCVMNPLDLLFETLRFFQLGRDYLAGEGHWDAWLARKIQQRNEETKQKGLLGKKKLRKKKGKERDSALKKPAWFDIEPFFLAMQKFVRSDLPARKRVCEVFLRHKKNVMQLFVRENFELRPERCVDFDFLAQFLVQTLQVDLPAELLEDTPHILVCFGGLQFETERVEVVEQSKFAVKRKKKPRVKTLRKLSFHELYSAIDRIKELDYLFEHKESLIANCEQRYQAFLAEREREIREQYRPEGQDHFKNAPDLEARLNQPPARLRNAISVNMFFIDKQYESYALHFISQVFQFFADKDFLLLSLPHSSPEFPLLRYFQQAPKKQRSNFSHCLYFYHRLNLLNDFVRLRRPAKKARQRHAQQLQGRYQLRKTDELFEIVCAAPGGQATRLGLVVGEKDLNLNFLKTRFELEPHLYAMAFRNNEVLSLKHFQLDGLFQNCTRFVLRELLRLTGSRLLVARGGVRSQAGLKEHFSDLRRVEVEKLMGQGRRPGWELSLLCYNSLVFPRRKINSRIFIVGASKSALGVLSRLLTQRDLTFANLNLLSPSFDWMNQFVRTKCEEGDVTGRIVERFKGRVNLLNGRLKSLNRKSRKITFESLEGKQFHSEYDVLVICNSLEEKTFFQLKNRLPAPGPPRARPPFFKSISELNELLRRMSNRIAEEQRRLRESSMFVRGRYDCFFDYKEEGGDEAGLIRSFLERRDSFHPPAFSYPEWLSFMKNEKNWFTKLLHPKKPHRLLFYGFSLQIFIAIEELVGKCGVRPANIVLLVPRRPVLGERAFGSNQEKIDHDELLVDFPQAFHSKELWEYYRGVLRERGVQVLEDHEIVDFNERELFVRNNGAEARPGQKGSRNVPLHKQESLDEENVLEFQDVFLVCSHFYDIQDEILGSIQDNGLVYNGRLIVQSNYQTIDPAIFACGKICEFSQRYKNQSFRRSLRMDKYNQFEVGRSCGDSLVALFRNEGAPADAPLPLFKEPIGFKARVFPGLCYIRIYFPYLGKVDFENRLSFEVSDRLSTEGYFFSFGFDSNQKLRRLVYLGRKELNYNALLRFMNLHRAHFNHMFKRTRSGLVKNYIDYLSQPWSEILFHPQFKNFSDILFKILNSYNRDIQALKELPISKWPRDLREMIEESTVDFIKKNRTHFFNYLVPS